ncbi:WD repeat-containing protein 5 isoform X3 [Mustela erminea]|uniref:WD repeat-containing protein 5 isoform X3 n=1 Tax=Mustela erminea TaxID=36723 RepID=UPI001386B18B|nr:WD repeat-containing protein 5 isoform X3 [Mustela erminea]
MGSDAGPGGQEEGSVLHPKLVPLTAVTKAARGGEAPRHGDPHGAAPGPESGPGILLGLPSAPVSESGTTTRPAPPALPVEGVLPCAGLLGRLRGPVLPWRWFRRSGRGRGVGGPGPQPDRVCAAAENARDPSIPVRQSPPLWASPSSSGLAGTHVGDPPGRPQSAALDSARDRPTPADAEVTALQRKARSASRPFKALGPPEAFCPSPLPVVPLREAGFVRSPRPAAAPPLAHAHAHCRRPPAPPRPARPGSRPGGGDATPRAPAPPPRPAARAHLPLALRCCSETDPRPAAGAGLARDPSALLSCRNAPSPTCCPPSAQPPGPVSPEERAPQVRSPGPSDTLAGAAPDAACEVGPPPRRQHSCLPGRGLPAEPVTCYPDASPEC